MWSCLLDRERLCFWYKMVWQIPPLHGSMVWLRLMHWKHIQGMCVLCQENIVKRDATVTSNSTHGLTDTLKEQAWTTEFDKITKLIILNYWWDMNDPCLEKVHRSVVVVGTTETQRRYRVELLQLVLNWKAFIISVTGKISMGHLWHGWQVVCVCDAQDTKTKTLALKLKIY